MDSRVFLSSLSLGVMEDRMVPDTIGIGVNMFRNVFWTNTVSFINFWLERVHQYLKHTRILSINEWINELNKTWHVDQNSQNNAWSFTIYYKIFDIYSQYCFKNIKNFIKKMVIFKENDNKITTQKIILIQCCVLKLN